MPDATSLPNQFCPNCGTEIDEDARFCPTCGTPIDMADDDPAVATQPMRAAEPRPDEPELPQAPVWPPPETQPDVPEPGPEPAPLEPLLAEPPPPAAPVASGPPPHEQRTERVELPFTLPTTLSGWLIGGGSLLGALALIPSLNDAVSLVLFLALLGVAATVFLTERLPEVPRLRLIVLSVSLVGLGVGFDRAAFGAAGFDVILFVSMIGAAGGALLVELDRDRPVPPPGGSATPAA